MCGDELDAPHGIPGIVQCWRGHARPGAARAFHVQDRMRLTKKSHVIASSFRYCALSH
jgi:hypothetical protein